MWVIHLTLKVIFGAVHFKATKLCPATLNVQFNIFLPNFWSELQFSPTSDRLTYPIRVTNHGEWTAQNSNRLWRQLTSVGNTHYKHHTKPTHTEYMYTVFSPVFTWGHSLVGEVRVVLLAGSLGKLEEDQPLLEQLSSSQRVHPAHPSLLELTSKWEAGFSWWGSAACSRCRSWVASQREEMSVFPLHTLCCSDLWWMTLGSLSTLGGPLVLYDVPSPLLHREDSTQLRERETKRRREREIIINQ